MPTVDHEIDIDKVFNLAVCGMICEPGQLGHMMQSSQALQQCKSSTIIYMQVLQLDKLMYMCVYSICTHGHTRFRAMHTGTRHQTHSL